MFVENASKTYRYGFNGKELDTEGMGGGLSTYDYGFRIYNPAICKFLSVDPLIRSFPWWSPYHFASNNPIKFIDLDGAESTVPENPGDNSKDVPKPAIFLNTKESIIDLIGTDNIDGLEINMIVIEGLELAQPFDLETSTESDQVFELWLPNYEPLFPPEDNPDAIITLNDPSGGLIHDAVTIADAASDFYGGVKAFMKLGISGIIALVKKFRTDLVHGVKNINADKIGHILDDKHDWDTIVDDPNNNFDKVQEVMTDVVTNGKPIVDDAAEGFGSMVKKVDGKWVEVRYGKSTDGSIKINDGWVTNTNRYNELDKLFPDN